MSRNDTTTKLRGAYGIFAIYRNVLQFLWYPLTSRRNSNCNGTHRRWLHVCLWLVPSINIDIFTHYLSHWNHCQQLPRWIRFDTFGTNRSKASLITMRRLTQWTVPPDRRTGRTCLWYRTATLKKKSFILRIHSACSLSRKHNLPFLILLPKIFNSIQFFKIKLN